MDALKVVLMACVGLVVGAVAGWLFALVFNETLFGWHDNIGPELQVTALTAAFGAFAGGLWQQTRNERARGGGTGHE